MDSVAISVQNVSMRFNLTTDRVNGLKEYFIKKLMRQIKYNEFWALRDVSFTVNKGEVFGVMGLNGAGKSTLLKIIAGVYKPTNGSVTVNGNLAPLLELGAGFDLEFSARDNVFFNGSILGHTHEMLEAKYDEIVEFSELHDFMQVAVKNFSSGMVGRLGFAIATSIQPDVVVCDEILGVGDYKFQKKCKERIQRMISSGVTVLLVSHNIQQIKTMCSRAVLLKKGEVISIGNVDEVCKAYGEG